MESGKVNLTKERINEIAYVMLLMTLSKQDIQFNPDQFKRRLSNLPQKFRHMPEQFRLISAEEIQEALRIIAHDLVEYSFNFDLKKKKRRKKKEK